MKTIHWGIIGCGDVTEVKSGPAFNKISFSRLVSVMRRDAGKAEDYARRHEVPHWCKDAGELLRDPIIDAVYIATPPDTHVEYALEALEAGKFVYLEKPMALNVAEAKKLDKYVAGHYCKIVVAHYRRAQVYFLKIKELISAGAIGDIHAITLSYKRKSLTEEELKIPKNAWRVDPAISGGGLFYDVAPHPLDLLYHWFGEPVSVQGSATRTNPVYDADDTVQSEIIFPGNVAFSGYWCFNADPDAEEDICKITGSKGSLEFSFFGNHPVLLQNEKDEKEFSFSPYRHVQQPMIERVVDYFRDKAPNPCTVREGLVVMKMMEQMTGQSLGP